MELGKKQQKIFRSNETFNEKDARRIYLKNIGDTNVSYGLLELFPNQSHEVSVNLSLEEKEIEIVFSENSGKSKKLYLEVVRYYKTVCHP